jgi:hypothetical protein
MRNVAALIGYVHLNHAMRVGPYKPRNGPLESDLFIRVVGRVAVVREQRSGNDQQASNRAEKGRKLISHCTPPYSCTRHDSVLHGRPRAGAMSTISVLTARIDSLIHLKSIPVNQIVFGAESAGAC